MKPIRSVLPPWSALLVSGACLLGAPAVAHGLEGILPTKVKDAVSTGSWSENCAGPWTVYRIVAEYNKCNSGMKIGIDSRLTQGAKSLTDWKTENISILASMELLSKKLNANLYVVRDFMYIAPEVPEGITIVGGHQNAPAAPADNKPPEPKKEDPPPGPPKAGGDKGGDKPPGTDKKTQKPPPNTTTKPPQLEKALPPLRPITPGTGLSELPAIFPGVKPGASPTVPWSHKSLKDTVADGRPIILFVSFFPISPDPKKYTPEETKMMAKLEKDQKDVAGYLETLILEDPQVMTELRGFNFIAIPLSEPADSWPAVFTDAAKAEGGALFVLPKDASRPVLQWASRSPAFTAAELVRAAKPLLGAPAVAAAKTPPKPGPAEVKKPDADKPEKPKEPEKPKKPRADGVQDE